MYIYINYQQQIQMQKTTIINKKKLKPLVISDIMVALINQQQTQDHTELYKSILYHNLGTQISDQNFKKPIRNRLPSFALQQLSAQQLLDYHIKNKTAEVKIFQYGELLGEVNQEIKLALENYSGRLKEGQSTIQQLIMSLNTTCQYLTLRRKYLLTTIQKVKQGYAGIAPKLRKINNIKKILQITKVWGTANLPYIMSINTKHPQHYNIHEILTLITSAQQTIQAQPQKSHALQKILTTLHQKQQTLLTNICQYFQNSIINFTDIDTYARRYQQYKILLQMNLCADVMTGDAIRKIIQLNSQKMFNDILERITPLKNVDLLSEGNYLGFYDEVIQEFVMYFRSWHYVTKYHINNQTGNQGLFLENRRYVFMGLSQVIAKSLKYSNKFISLQYKIKLELCEKLEDYIEAGIKWMGYYQNSFIMLKKELSGKMNKQLQKIFTLYNNLIKNMLAKQLSMSALETVDEPEQEMTIRNTESFEDIDYEKVIKFLSDDYTELKMLDQQSHEQTSSKYRKKQNTALPNPPVIKLKMCQILVEMIYQYIERSKYLESNKAIYIQKIVEHFQFIIFSLFQVSVRRHIYDKLYVEIKQSLNMPNDDLKSPGFNSSPLKIGNEDGPSLKKMNQLWKIQQLQRKYETIVGFSDLVSKKYDGTVMSGFLDVDRVYDTQQLHLIIGYMKLQSRLIRDLIGIQDWLIKIIPQTNLKSVKRGIEQITRVKNITKNFFSLVIQNHNDYVSKKILEYGMNIVPKLKWQIKKFNQDSAQMYKEYKSKIMEIFRTFTLNYMVNSECKDNREMISIVRDLQLENFYKNMLEIYGKIQKINDNGRQLLRLDYLQFTKSMRQLQIVGENQPWETWFEKYLQFSSQRSYKTVLDKVNKIGILYPPLCWKYHILWIIGQLSSKQKKQYYSQLNKIYLQYLSEGG